MSAPLPALRRFKHMRALAIIEWLQGAIVFVGCMAALGLCVASAFGHQRPIDMQTLHLPPARFTV